MKIGSLVFDDVDKDAFIYHNFIKKSCIAIYDEQSVESLKYLIENLSLIEAYALEITANNKNQELVTLLKKNNFFPNYDWFIYEINKDNIKTINNIKEIFDRGLVRDLLINQEHELSQRMPLLFDINGEEDDWTDCGDNCIIYTINSEIISVLTYTIENYGNIHIYLTYTVPKYRSQGIGSQMIDYVKKIGRENNIKTITICTDVTKQNRVPKMFKKNGFKYFKTGYYKIIK